MDKAFIDEVKSFTRKQSKSQTETAKVQIDNCSAIEYESFEDCDYQFQLKIASAPIATNKGMYRVRQEFEGFKPKKLKKFILKKEIQMPGEFIPTRENVLGKE